MILLLVYSMFIEKYKVWPGCGNWERSWTWLSTPSLLLSVPQSPWVPLALWVFRQTVSSTYMLPDSGKKKGCSFSKSQLDLININSFIEPIWDTAHNYDNVLMREAWGKVWTLHVLVKEQTHLKKKKKKVDTREYTPDAARSSSKQSRASC